MGAAMLSMARADAADEDRRGGASRLPGSLQPRHCVESTRAARRPAALLRRHRRLRDVGLRERRARARAPRCAAGTCATRSSCARSAAIEVDVGGEPRAARGLGVRRLDRAPAPDRGHAAGRVPRGARRRAAVDRRRRRARQDDDGGDDRVRAAGDRPRPGLDHRRRSCRSSAGTPAPGRAGSSSRATSPTARSARLRPQIAVLTNIELDHHATYALRGGAARRSSTTGSRTCRTSSAAGSSSRSSSTLGVPGRAQPPERRRGRSPRSSWRACRAPRPRRRSSRFTRRRAAARARRRGGRRDRLDDYGHNPTELEVTLQTARELDGGPADRRLPAARRRAHAPAPRRARRGARRSPTPRS